MKKLLVLSVGIALLAATLPLMAQAPANGRVMKPPIRVLPGPQSPNKPSGLLPRQVLAAYGFNQLPNFGAGVTIALVDAYDDPNIASDLAFYASYFHFGPCNFTKVKLGTVQGQGWDVEESLDVEQACALHRRPTSFWLRPSATITTTSITPCRLRLSRRITLTLFP